MTDRVNRLTVVLDSDYRDDDVKFLIEGISQFRGVLKVKPHIADTADYMAIERAKADLRDKILDLLR